MFASPVLCIKNEVSTEEADSKGWMSVSMDNTPSLSGAAILPSPRWEWVADELWVRVGSATDSQPVVDIQYLVEITLSSLLLHASRYDFP